MKQLKIDRKYLGVIVTSENYKDILKGPGKRDDLRFHTKHLRAYLQGRDSFFHGWVIDEEGERIRPQEHQVQQELILKYWKNDQPSFYHCHSQKALQKYIKENKFGKSK